MRLSLSSHPCGGQRVLHITGVGHLLWAEALWHSVFKIHPGEALDRRRDFPPLRHFVPTYLVTHRVRLARISESSAPFETAEAELEAEVLNSSPVIQITAPPSLCNK